MLKLQSAHLEGHDDFLLVQHGVYKLWVSREVGDYDAVQDLQHNSQEVCIHLQLVRLVTLLFCNPLQPLISAQTEQACRAQHSSNRWLGI